MAATNTDYSKILKEWYTDDRVTIALLKNCPAAAFLTKKEFGGKYEPIPIIFGHTGGHGASYTASSGNKGSPYSDAFNLTAQNQYALSTLPRKTMLQSQKNIGAFLPAARGYIDGALDAWARDFAIHLFRDGSGFRGRVLTFAAGVITLTQRYDAVNFNPGDKLEFNAAKDGNNDTTVDATQFTVTAVDTSAGTVTGTVDVGPNPDPNDWIFGKGDKGIVFYGMDGWFTQATPTATAFFNVNRTQNPTMLSGVKSNGTGKLRYEALIDAQSEIAAIGGGMPDVAFCHPADFRALVKEMEAVVTRPRPVTKEARVSKNSEATVGFTGIVVQGDAGEIEVYSDRFQQPNICHVLESNTCGIAHIGPMLSDIVGRASDEGMLVEPSSDGYEIRVAGYPQFYSRAPGHNASVFNFGL